MFFNIKEDNEATSLSGIVLLLKAYKDLDNSNQKIHRTEKKSQKSKFYVLTKAWANKKAKLQPNNNNNALTWKALNRV